MFPSQEQLQGRFGNVAPVPVKPDLTSKDPTIDLIDRLPNFLKVIDEKLKQWEVESIEIGFSLLNPEVRIILKRRPDR